MDTRRLILFIFFSMAILWLWDTWMSPPSAPVPATSHVSAVPKPSTHALTKGQQILVSTDLYQITLDTTGGDVRRLMLKQQYNDKHQPFVLMQDNSKDAVYIAQTGLLGSNLPAHQAVFSADASNYQLDAAKNSLTVPLRWEKDGVAVDKIYTFYRNSYRIDVRYVVHNNTPSPLAPTIYYQIVHDNQSDQGSRLMPSFTGAAYFSADSKFKKLSFDDMSKEALQLSSPDGWIGFLQHYFVSAWIPGTQFKRSFYSEKLDDHLYSIGVKIQTPSIASGHVLEVPAYLFAGPQIQSQLKQAAPGLEYSVDYGWLTIIASPLFWLLSWIYKWVGNWGVAIILLTMLIKLAFFRLSATGYRSMAQMRELAPRLQALKERFGDDRQKMQMAVMELYKSEKINPLGGCLPILLQIPVFIAFYWVLLGSVELRHAPFFAWINDLSAADPYYILPVLMTATMLLQTRLNPTPPDPLQAKLMLWMPLIFSVFFFFFPAGLVLYWLVNNILSIAQQMYMNRQIHLAVVAKQQRGKR